MNSFEVMFSWFIGRLVSWSVGLSVSPSVCLWTFDKHWPVSFFCGDIGLLIGWLIGRSVSWSVCLSSLLSICGLLLVTLACLFFLLWYWFHVPTSHM